MAQPEPDVLVLEDGTLRLGHDTRRCPGCGRIYVLREYVNPCPVCNTKLPAQQLQNP